MDHWKLNKITYLQIIFAWANAELFAKYRKIDYFSSEKCSNFLQCIGCYSLILKDPRLNLQCIVQLFFLYKMIKKVWTLGWKMTHITLISNDFLFHSLNFLQKNKPKSAFYFLKIHVCWKLIVSILSIVQIIQLLYKAFHQHLHYYSIKMHTKIVSNKN